MVIKELLSLLAVLALFWIIGLAVQRIGQVL